MVTTAIHGTHHILLGADVGGALGGGHGALAHIPGWWERGMG
jgi:hypothetical protein